MEKNKTQECVEMEKLTSKKDGVDGGAQAKCINFFHGLNRKDLA